MFTYRPRKESARNNESGWCYPGLHFHLGRFTAWLPVGRRGVGSPRSYVRIMPKAS